MVLLNWPEMQEIFIRLAQRSIDEHEEDPYKRGGFRAGLRLAKSLETREDYESCLQDRHRKEARLATQKAGRGKDKEIRDYWRYHCATAQVEFMFERFKAFHGMAPVSVRALQHLSQVVAELREKK